MKLVNVIVSRWIKYLIYSRFWFPVGDLHDRNDFTSFRVDKKMRSQIFGIKYIGSTVFMK